MMFENIDLENYEIISFDIFDTLIIRYVEKPEDIFSIIEYKIKDAIDFKNKRINAEKIARRKFEREITIDDIYSELKNIYNKSLIDLLKLTEICVELEFCTKREEVYRFYNKCLEYNKRIIITSDMYLPRNVINKILVDNDILQYENLYLSSELGMCKKDGKLFKYIVKELNVLPSKILHIGDNKISDYKIPNKMGIKALLINKININNHNSYLLTESIYSKIIDRFIYINLERKCEKNYTYKIGYKTFGIILYGFSLWLKKELENKKINKVYFLSRDGWILQKAFNILQFDRQFKSDYLFASRRALIVPCIWMCNNYSEVKNLLSIKPVTTTNEFFNKLGVNFSHLGISKLNLEKSINAKEQETLYKKWKNKINENSKNEYNAVKKYLEQKEFKGKLSVVDIGWFGNMQKAFYSLTSNKEIIGFYIGTRRKGEIDTLKYIKRKGYLFNKEKNSNYWFIAAMNSLFETFFLANHGSVKKFYIDKNSEIKIEFYDYEYLDNVGQAELIKNFQQGALDFIEDLSKCPIVQYIKFDNNFICNSMVNTFLYPSKKICDLFGDMIFLDNSYTHIAKPNTLNFYIKYPKKLFSDFKNCQWKVAFLSRLLNIYTHLWFNLYYLLKSIKKDKK